MSMKKRIGLFLTVVTLTTTLFGQENTTTTGKTFLRWSTGLNIGIPFFWGDMQSMAADKTHVGMAVGIQGSYLFSKKLGVTLSVDYAHGKMGSRSYAKDYLLTPDGQTHYTQTTGAYPYKDLYAKTSLVNIGIGADINLNGLLDSRTIDSPFSVWLTPTIYGQCFSTKTYTVAEDRKFSDGTTKPGHLSLGLGGALSLRYRLADTWSIQLKNTVLWMTDNKFDAIVTPYGHTRHNAMWMPQLGVLWTLGR